MVKTRTALCRRARAFTRLPALITALALLPPAAAIGGQPAPPQFPGLFSGYPTRPAWKVAGVDYAVGVPADITLLDPANITTPGVSLDRSSHLVYVTGDNVVLDGYDFSLEGGWGLYVTGANDTILNCNFMVGENNIVPIDGSSSASNLTIRRSTINGGGVGVVGNAAAIWAIINYDGTGLTVEASWLSYTPEDAIDYNGNGTLIVRRNLFNNLGYTVGAHADSVQFTRGTVTNSVISSNTVYDPQPVGGFPVQGGEGLQVEAQLGGTITNTRLANNTIVTTGPVMTAGYLIAVRQDSDSILNGIHVENNFLDPTGGWGPFYPPSGSNLWYNANMDLVSGQMYPPPQGTNDAVMAGASTGR